MGFDIRLPIGSLLLAIGVLLAISGAMTGPNPSAHTLGLNINLWWGLLMCAVGAVFIGLARRRR